MIRLATKTLQLIKESIEKDQGTAYRAALQEILPKIDDAYRESGDFRRHLGASLIGRDCAFELWLGFRWAETPQFSERILRLFNRGHLEEAHFLAMLKCSGIPVYYETEDGGQFRFSDVDGHFGSALDGVVMIPDLDDWAYSEFKTHNEKSFNKLVKEGVHNSKFEHYVQMQLCMNNYKLKYGVYFAVNKNDDSLYIEIIKADPACAKQYRFRAKGIIYATEAPPRISNKESWYQCKYCSKLDICHRGKKPAINCRTCKAASPTEDGSWKCSLGNNEIHETPKIGCSDHAYHPGLIIR